MAQRTIIKTGLRELVDAVRKDGRFYGPVKADEGEALSESFKPDDGASLNYYNFKLPAKRLFFPHTEVICTYDGETMTDVPLPEEKVVIFGMRPCDALSLARLDKVFLDEEFVDPYYRSRRENAVVISLACNDPLETCFCTSVEGSPAGTEGADILAFDLGDSLLFETVSEKGEAFVATHAALFREPAPQETEARDKVAAAAEKKVPQLDVAGLTEKLQQIFDSPIWETMSERCLGCGVCTHLCPTCHCFGLHDEKAGSGGRRIRVQDCCVFPSFTSEASGHNPRPSSGERMRQRIMHKFRYTVENFGDTFCVGCARCITNCPVNMDLRETLAEVMK